MAEVVLSSLLKAVFGQIAVLIAKKLYLLKNVDEDLRELSNKVLKFERELEDAELKEIKCNKAKTWLVKLHLAANDAKEILDKALLLDADSEHETRPVCLSPFTCFGSCAKCIASHHIAKRIKSIVQRFDDLEKEKSALVFDEIEIFRVTTSALLEPETFSRDDDKEKILTALLSASNNQTDLQVNPFIYSIVAHGGMGKTTLAQSIFNDDSVIQCFGHHRMWVWVSETFNVEILMKQMLESLSDTKCELQFLDSIQRRIRNILHQKKFLLVLDDAWNDNKDKWQKLMSPLSCGAPGSCVLLTTRQDKVARASGSHEEHHLTPLSHGDCWSLFKKHAFCCLGDEDTYPDLVKIAKEIVEKCGGFPLLAKTLGGSLRSTRDVCSWMYVRDDLEGIR